jgi:hypothetical protein
VTGFQGIFTKRSERIMSKSADQMVTNWKNAMASPTTSQNYSAGVQATQVNPMALAAAASDRYAQGTAAAVASGKFQNALNSTPKSTWVNNSVTKGAPRLSSGATAALPKYQAFANKWAPIYANVSQAVAAMPKGGLANAQARSNTAIQMLMQAAGKA